MDVKKKLVELIEKGCICPNDANPFYCDTECQYNDSLCCGNERLADYLIANGVTVQGATDNDVAYKLKATDTVKPNDDVRSHRVKLDINNLFREIDDLLSKIEEETLEKTVFGVGVGLELLISYLRQIATRAIELNDDVLIGLLLDLHVLKKEG